MLIFIIFLPSPPFRAILSFSRRAHWLSCCAHGGFFVCLGVEEWERWATWVGFRCGAVASALLRQSRDTAEALSEMFLVAPCALSEGKSAKPWTFAVFAVLSPLIDTSQMWVAFAQILPLAMRIRWSLSLIFLDFKCVTMWI